MSDTLIVKRALISVADKTGLDDFARQLAASGVEILSTGGTAARLRELGIPVRDVSDYTGHPEMMAGRIKTLHPRVHGGLLGRRGVDDTVMAEHGIAPIDLVICNLYPFEATIAKPDCTLADAIENIDIGGPAMVRSAAKNHADVAIVVDTADYSRVLEEINSSGGISRSLRATLAQRAFALTAHYDTQIATYLTLMSADAADTSSSDHSADESQATPAAVTVSLKKVSEMRYGENPHQRAALYTYTGAQHNPQSLVHSDVLQGKALSFNNVADADAAWACVCEFDQTACVIVKHANPCGVACAASLTDAYDKAYKTDPVSAFGGIIAFNRPLDAQTAQAIVDRQFVEVILAPGVDDDARQIIAARKNVRLLQMKGRGRGSQWNMKAVDGGVLLQSPDHGTRTARELQCVTAQQPDSDQVVDLLFAWRVAKFVKSNAIVYASKQATVGVGAGQMSRVYSARIAAIKAADESIPVRGAVMASDAFFPFRDGIDQAHEAGIVAIIQPGGSKRDEEVIAAANEHGMSMMFTGMRHFRH